MQNQMVLMMDTLATLGLPFDTNIVEIDKNKINEVVLFLRITRYVSCLHFREHSFNQAYKEGVMQIEYRLFHIDDLLDTFETYVRGILWAEDFGESQKLEELTTELLRVREELRFRCG